MRTFLSVVFASLLGASAFGFDTSFATPTQGERTVKTVDPRGDARAVVRVDVPIADIQEAWMPSFSVPKQTRKWALAATSGPQMDMPYLAFINVGGGNRFSVATDTLELDTEIVSRINQEKGVFEITVTVAAEKGRRIAPFRVTLDRRDVVWTKALGDWRDSLAYPRVKYPDAAWKPVYCSWYAAHAAISQDWTERTGRIAADLGFKTFILDDGWSYDESKRVNPKTIGTWYRDVGKWDSFSTVKFPDFRAHRERMREMGLKYIVWTAPYLVGTRSPAFKELGFDRRPDMKAFEGNVVIDIQNRASLESMTAQLVKLMRDTGIDGLKIDFLDQIQPSCADPHAGTLLAYMRGLVGAVRAVKPDALIEFRQSYATPVTSPLATQFRAGDVPFEWLDNLLRIAQIRLAMGDGVPVHADPIYWSPYETPDNVNRHFLAAMAGVPMLSMDLQAMGERDRATVRRWLGYYRRFVERFQRDGKWEVIYKNGGLAAVTSSLEDAVLLIVNDPDVAPRLEPRIGGKSPVVLNLTRERIAFGGGVSVAPAAAYPGE